jgi:hypothetical protein
MMPRKLLTMHENDSTICVTPPDRRGLELLIERGYVSIWIQPGRRTVETMTHGTPRREIVSAGWTPPAWALAIDGLCYALAEFVDRIEIASVLS